MSAPAPTTHLYLLLDRSGSMASIADDVIGGFNAFLAGQAADGVPTVATVVQFDDRNPQEVLADGVPVAEVVPLTPATFTPRGSTPLLDATAMVVERATTRALRRSAAGRPAEEIIVMTITDGHENASRRTTLAQLRALVADRQAAGWTFVYLSADLDGYADAKAMGYGEGSTQLWEGDGEGTRMAFDALSASVSARKLAYRQAPHAVDPNDFFKGDKPAEEYRYRRRPR